MEQVETSPKNDRKEMAGLDAAALILELDGVLLNTAELYRQAWKQAAEECGIAFDPAWPEKMAGLSHREVLEILAGHSLNTPQAEEMVERKTRLYREAIEQLTPAAALPGAAGLLQEARERGMRVAVTAGGHSARRILERIGLLGEIDALVAASSVPHARPAPDLPLRAARVAGTAPERCVVIESTPEGIAAGLAAGMWTVGVGERERLGAGDLVYRTLSGVPLSEILDRLGAGGSWRIRELAFDPARQHAQESALTTGNGYLGTRGSLEEGFPEARPATLINGVYDDVATFKTELANALDWLDLRLALNGESFSLQEGTVLQWERCLDMRDGALTRRVLWRSPTGKTVQLTFQRCPSMAEPHRLALRCRVRSVDFRGRVEVEAGLNCRVETVGTQHWTDLGQGRSGDGVFVHRRTKSSGIELAAAAALRVDVPARAVEEYRLEAGCPMLVAHFSLEVGEEACIDKFVTLWTSRDTADPLGAALAELPAAVEAGYAALRRASASRWGEIWRDSNVVIEGDDVADRAVRFNLFQLLIAAPWHEDRVSIPARNLSGFGYRGHVFWDTEIFIVPFFTWTQPQVARNLLMYRYRTLDGARKKARDAGYAGASFAWESADTGEETTPAWVTGFDGKPARVWCGDIELHISADVAYAVWNYWRVTGDDEFMRDYGAEIVLETARFWASRLEYNAAADRYELRNVIGPDEYHERVDNNAFTNAMAAWNLRTAVQLLDWLRREAPEQAAALSSRLHLSEKEAASWSGIANRVYMPTDPRRGLLEQFAGFFGLEQVEQQLLAKHTRAMDVVLGRERTQKSQVLKQPDVLMLMYLLPDNFSEEEKRAHWHYYEPITDHAHGSSLGPAIHVALGAQLGFDENAYSRFIQAALMDLQDLRGNTRDGIHAAAAGGVWQAVAYGFAGLAANGSGPAFRPRLPGHWQGLYLQVRYRGQPYRVDVANCGPTG